MILPVKAPAAAPAAAPIDAPRTLPVAAAPMIAPVAARHPAPWPTGGSHELRIKALSARTQIARFFVINLRSLTDSTAQPRECCRAESKRLQELRRDPAGFLQPAEAILLFENAKLVALYSAKQTAINRAHDFGRHHRPAIFRWKRRSGAREKLSRARGFEFHQANEPLVILSISQLGLRIIQTRQILLWQINSTGLQIFADITNDVRHLQGQSELKRIFFAPRVAISKNLDAHQTHSASHPVAINAQILERRISEDGQVHLYAGDDFLQHLR